MKKSRSGPRFSSRDYLRRNLFPRNRAVGYTTKRGIASPFSLQRTAAVSRDNTAVGRSSSASHSLFPLSGILTQTNILTFILNRSEPLLLYICQSDFRVSSHFRWKKRRPWLDQVSLRTSRPSISHLPVVRALLHACWHLQRRSKEAIVLLTKCQLRVLKAAQANL